MRFSEVTEATLEFWGDVIDLYAERLRAEIVDKRVDPLTWDMLFLNDPGRLLLIQTRERIRAMAIPIEIIFVGADGSQTAVSPQAAVSPPLS